MVKVRRYFHRYSFTKNIIKTIIKYQIKYFIQRLFIVTKFLYKLQIDLNPTVKA